MKSGDLIIRRLRDEDSLEDLTNLLHRAYQSLADRGMRYFASHQTVEDTRRRIDRGECFVAELNGQIIGTITWYCGPSDKPDPPLYAQPGIASFGQFAVDSQFQRRGIGRQLLNQVENEARRRGCTKLALDTSERATHLIDWYIRLGFQHAGFAQWGETNYRSVLMSKLLTANEG